MFIIQKRGIVFSFILDNTNDLIVSLGKVLPLSSLFSMHQIKRHHSHSNFRAITLWLRGQDNTMDILMC